MNSSNPDQRVRCLYCENVSYTNTSGLQTHLRRVHNKSYGQYKHEFREQFNISDDEKILKCELCGFESNNLNRHIERTHSMTPKDYVEKFPGTMTCQLTRSQVAKMSETKNKKDSLHKKQVVELAQRSEAVIAEYKSVLVCEMCGYQSATSLISHITHKHKIEMKEYRSKWPNSVVQRSSAQQREKNSLVTKRLFEDCDWKEKFLKQCSPFPSQTKHWTQKGLSFEDAVKKVFEFQREQSLKGNNEKTRAKRSQKNSGCGNPMSLESIAQRENISLEEAQKLTPCYGRCGEKHPMFGKKHSEEALRKISSAPHLSNPDYRSNPERELEQECLKLGNINHNQQVKRWNVDIFFKDRKLIVEMFGDFWHMNPNKYVATDMHGFFKKKETAQQVWERDARKLQELRDQGYTVIVVWESDWRLRKEEIMKEIKDAYDRTC